VLEVENIIKKEITPTWAMILDDYLVASANRGLTKKTISDTEYCLRAHTIGAWGERFIDSITTQDVRELLQARVGHRKASHQKYVLKCMRSVFSYAVDAGNLNRNPTPMMKFKLGDKIKAVLTEEQAKFLIAKAREFDSEWAPHYEVALYTGMRNGELYALKRCNIDFSSNTILVNSSWNSKDGFKSTKSGDDRRIDIPAPLLPVLQELMEEDDSEFLLPRLTKWDKGEQARELRMFLLGIGLPAIRFHDLRATWATMLLSKGVEPIKVMKMGGWKDIETMMIYARKAGVDIKGASACLNLQSPSPTPIGGAQAAQVIHMARQA
jgi:integrase